MISECKLICITENSQDGIFSYAFFFGPAQVYSCFEHGDVVVSTLVVWTNLQRYSYLYRNRDLIEKCVTTRK